MERQKHLPYFYTLRFDRTIYEAAERHEIDAIPLLSALESSRTIACGVASLLNVVRNHGLTEEGSNGDTLISHMHADDLISLCVESMNLLNTKIEILADQLSVKHPEK
ncbi:hypothetical protein [Pollutimonas sp. M17]|uniref:hypothetical protein n=1 Tax=Pollutimonas sp. M17 TaxID=2962065 RepID=UPI0021F4A8C1|nr:hypothetical protein [Pollutimonas sp. M17]UYO93361.1 hypothetical protein OEG81_15950 [Pollutimonas sp. M17]